MASAVRHVKIVNCGYCNYSIDKSDSNIMHEELTKQDWESIYAIKIQFLDGYLFVSLSRQGSIRLTGVRVD